MRRWAGRLFLVLGSASLALLAGEFTLRRVAPQPGINYPRGLFEADDKAGFRLAPGFHGVLQGRSFSIDVAINEHGLRGPPLRDRNDGHRRILLVGDSFVFGFCVPPEQTIGAELTRMLEPLVPGLEVLAAGVPGYGPREELSLVQRLLAEVAPDVVVHCFFAGNDVQDALRGRANQTVFRGFLVGKAVPGQYGGTFGPLRFELYRLWSATQLFRLIGILRYQASAEIPGAEVRAATLKSDELGWLGVEKSLGQLIDLCAKSAVPLVVVALPSEQQVGPKPTPADAEALKVELDRLRWPQRSLATFLQSRGIPLADLTEPIAALNATERAYQALDNHFNAAGNRVAAEGIRALLERAGLVERLQRR